MRTRTALAAVLTAATSIIGIAGLSGTAYAGAGGPYGTGISILSVTPNPVVAGGKIHIEIQERTATGKFFPFKITGPCIGDYEFDPSAYLKLPFAFKGSFHADLVVFKDYAGSTPGRETESDDEEAIARANGGGVTTTTKPSTEGGKPCVITITGFPPSGNVSDTFTITVLPVAGKVEGKKDTKKIVEVVRPQDPISGDTFGAAVEAVRSEALPAQQAAVAVQPAAVVVAATPSGETKVAGVSVTNSAVTLPRTGSSSMAQAWLGGALAAIGAGFVLFARRRVRHADIRSRYLS